jgi:transcriptional regulator with XRE-family HTH domain
MPRIASSVIAPRRVVGRTIREARRRAGLTQADLAERLHASPPCISSLEAGKTNPTVGQLWAIADALRVEVRVELLEPAPLDARAGSVWMSSG